MRDTFRRVTSASLPRPLVHGLTTLLIDQRLSFLGVSTDEAERHARQAGMALFEGLRAKEA